MELREDFAGPKRALEPQAAPDSVPRRAEISGDALRHRAPEGAGPALGHADLVHGDAAHRTWREPPGNRDAHGPPAHPAGPEAIQHRLDNQFAKRYASGDLKHLTHGHAAGQIRLDDQYRLLQAGDVARRLDVSRIALHGTPGFDEKHFSVTDPRFAADMHDRFYGHGRIHDPFPYLFYHGRIGPRYSDHCFPFYYPGCALFARTYWYPRWTPWVRWSWRYPVHPLWDPRPVYCRPIVYAPCAAWTYWTVPVWEPLPVVSSGTWVDVPLVSSPADDLQLLAVRFVDPGHPDEKLGPRYRVWFRSNGASPVDRAFNVFITAGLESTLEAGLSGAGVRVMGIGAGETQSVDIRLPIEVTALARDAQGQAMPFERLHVLLDADREIDEMSESNNGASLARTEVLPVDPAVFEIEPDSAAAGDEVVLAGEGLGPAPGRVLVQLGGLELDAEILGWYDLGVRVALPDVPVASPTEADVVIVRGDGAAANPLRLTIHPRDAARAPSPQP